MKKTATEIAQQVLLKIATEHNRLIQLSPQRRKALKTTGAMGGGILGSLFGGLAGAGFGGSIRSFPGHTPTTQVGKILSKVIHNPVGRGIAYTLPYLGLGVGGFLGAQRGQHLFDVGPELDEAKVRRALKAYLQKGR